MSSKIRVDTIENVAGSGNVSLGSGHNLVVPGNITGSGTATITGNVLTNGQLSVNTSSGNEKLNVHGAIRTSAPSANFNAGLEGGIFDFTGSVARVGHVNGASGSAKDIQFITAGTAKMTLNGSGQLTKPFQPFFFAKPTASGDGQTRSPYKFENVIHNVGSGFVTSGTGAHERFVAPVTGNYLFSTMPGYLQGNVNHGTRVQINGGDFAELSRFIQGSAGSHCGFGASIILRLSANDFVTLVPQYTPYHLNTNTCFFCGMLIG